MPGKVLMPLSGKPALEHVIRRCQAAQSVDHVIVATTVNPEDRAIVDFVKGLDVKVFPGSVNDVLDRYYQAARLFKFQHIVRITGDCPMIDPDVIDCVVTAYFDSGVDYASNILEPLTYPDGEDVEVFNFKSLELAWREAKMLSEREHVTPYIKNNKIFKTSKVAQDADWSQQRWTLDESQDYKKLSAIFDALYQKDAFFHMKDIARFLAEHPEADRMNTGISRNEGYQKSLSSDRKAA